MEQIKVLLADEQEIFREGLARLLDEREEIEVVSRCSNGNQAVEKAGKVKPDVVLIDSYISECNSIKATRDIKKSSPRSKVAMLTNSKNEDELFSAMEAGATGYLVKDIKVGDLVESIDLIGKGEVVVSPPLAANLIRKLTSTKAKEAGVKDDLSEREMEIVKRLAQGATNKEIAEALFIAENTAKVHLKNILEKLQLRNRQQVSTYAALHGLVTEVRDTKDESG